MTILLFVLAGVLVGYVVYTFYSSNAGQISNAPSVRDIAEVKTVAADKPAVPAAKAESKPSRPPAASEDLPTQYRNPKTGETAAIPTNYRFAKRWIKEALVSEGLLDKIYKTNELDDQTTLKVKTALDEFKVIKKYHA